MARLPDAIDLGGLNPERFGRNTATYNPGGGLESAGLAVAKAGTELAQGIQNIGKGLDSATTSLAYVAGRDQKATDDLETAKAKAVYQVRTQQLRDQLAKETDPAGLSEKYTPLFNAARDDAATFISNPRRQDVFKTAIAPDVEKNTIAVGDRFYSLNRDNEVASAQGQLESLRDSALRETDPERRAEYIRTGTQLIQGLKDKGYIDAPRAQKLGKSWVENYAVAAISSKPPEEQINLLRSAPAGKEAVLDRIGGVENASGDPAARNPSSTAMGNFQFTNQTWLDTIKTNRPDLAQGKSDKDLLALRADPRLSREMAGYLYDANSTALAGAGLPGTAANVYLAHFLGAPTAIKVLQATPDTAIADVVSADAIKANPSILAGKTVGSVVAWAGRKMGGSARGVGNLIDFIPEDQRVGLLQKAQTRVANDEKQSASDTALEQYTVKSQVADDIASMTNTGTGIDSLSADRVRLALGSKAAQEWQDKRGIAHDVYMNTHDLPQMTEADIYARVRSLVPTAGQENFAARQDVHDQVVKAANAILKQRADDPAESVSRDPNVQTAMAQLDKNDPGTAGALYAARLAAQAKAGIPEDAQSPITKAEALRMVAPLRRMMPGQERDVLTQLAQDFKTQFGPNADKAFEYALKVHKLDADTSRIAARIMTKLGLGELPTAGEARAVDHSAEVSAADRAVAGVNGYDPTFPTGQPIAAAPVTPPEPVANIPAKAIIALSHDPSRAPEFDAKYGKGASKRVLDMFVKQGGK